MKIRMPTPSKLLIEIGKKILIIQGEATFNEKKTPAIVFYANMNSIRNWEPPFDQEFIDQRERNLLIKRIIKESEKTNFKVIFD